MSAVEMFMVPDPNPEQFIYEITGDPQEDFPEDVRADMIGARIHIDSNDMGSSSVETDLESGNTRTRWIVGVSAARLIVGLESQGKLTAADYFTRKASQADIPSTREVTFWKEGRVLDPDTQEELHDESFEQQIRELNQPLTEKAE